VVFSRSLGLLAQRAGQRKLRINSIAMATTWARSKSTNGLDEINQRPKWKLPLFYQNRLNLYERLGHPQKAIDLLPRWSDDRKTRRTIQDPALKRF